ncbi:PREDICTED: probable LRR receptor-like serine/threonine-protein kinase At4g36180 isoform X2 [Nelumbo nucifera]|uniref:Probable LRR receptor-like serine/threonine-protein kinase At4g36180 isoform X2 n=1 Tax=Nelumbo nucifera TaxID=4432 RepID=A0A1U7Z2K9_NELNU|nr:PREDICTED: probable LRR receptor-like serine/threonine-protein kinase At4g36180 isoform X2 [Nelumbo nucifera]
MGWWLWFWVLLAFVVEFQVHKSNGCLEKERVALLELKTSIFQPDGSSLSTWDDEEGDCCEWEGVKCNNTTKRVIQISLSGARQGDWNLNASLFLPFEELQSLNLSSCLLSGWVENEGFERLSRLRNLEVLDLSWNSLNDTVFSSLKMLSSLKSLNLSNNAIFESTHIQELAGLINLEVLNLGNNEIGSFPTVAGLCTLKNLEELDLSMNGFEGNLPSCLENLTSLRVLDLSSNQFGGNISSSLITSLRSLEYLSLSDNRFQGPFSFSSLANHSKLEAFANSNNELVLETDYSPWVPTFQLKILLFSNSTIKRLSGSIPKFLQYQYDLRVVDLSHNNFEGEFPNWLLENNTRLEILNLKNNSLTGQFLLPSHPNRDTSILDISRNHISGEIPTNIGTILPNLLVLNMSSNSLRGRIPSSLGDMKRLQALDLSNNRFLGGIPENLATGYTSLELIKLSNCNLKGQILPSFSNLTRLHYLYLDGNQFTGEIPDILSNSSELKRLDISHNNISGKLPWWMGNMSSLEALKITNNHLEGPIPVEFCSLNDLRIIDLSENNLSGSIPDCFSPPFLFHARFQKNGFTGPMTTAFSKSSYLVTLNIAKNYLTGRIPDWIGKLQSLSILLLDENNFQGKIPTQLCQLSKITILDLSHNNLSGTIPSCLSNLTFKVGFRSGKYRLQQGSPIYSSYSFQSLVKESGDLDLYQVNFYSYIAVYEVTEMEFTTKTRSYNYKGNSLYYMTGIDFSSNRLTGDIPPEIGNLGRLRAFNLSHNLLAGPIPTSFSNLEKIESLDLSYNNLAGTIPSELSNLNSLAVFSVAHNNLSGQIPDRKQFATFEESSYEGNPLLCGSPFEKSCSTLEPTPFNNEREDKDFMDTDSFYLSFGISYTTVLIGFIGILYINNSWRRLWFNLLD